MELSKTRSEGCLKFHLQINPSCYMGSMRRHRRLYQTVGGLNTVMCNPTVRHSQITPQAQLKKVQHRSACVGGKGLQMLNLNKILYLMFWGFCFFFLQNGKILINVPYEKCVASVLYMACKQPRLTHLHSRCLKKNSGSKCKMAERDIYLLFWKVKITTCSLKCVQHLHIDYSSDQS